MNQLAKINSHENMLSINDIKQQIKTIHQLLKDVMIKDEHYGVIPGCGDKPALLKPGAEKINMAFRLAPKYVINRTPFDNGHREYEIICTLKHISSGAILGEGVGCCSTMENKFRYRWDNTGKEVPEAYWQNRDKDLLGGDIFCARKSGRKWMIYKRVEHDNPADYYNTCLKMAKKRALVDATLTATAASDIFIQDVDETPPDDSFEQEEEKTKHEETLAKTMDANDDGTFSMPDDDKLADRKKTAIQDLLDSTDDIKEKLNIIADFYAQNHSTTKEAVLLHFSAFKGRDGSKVKGLSDVNLFTPGRAKTVYGKIKKELDLN